MGPRLVGRGRAAARTPSLIDNVDERTSMGRTGARKSLRAVWRYRTSCLRSYRT
jgi:hypothetical protein